MNARNSMMTKTSIALTSLAVCGVLCAGACGSNSTGEPGTGTGTNTSTSTSTGGTSGTVCPNPDKVEFSNGAATCAMNGWGWIALGTLDKATDPTCGGTPITHENACTTSTTWNATDALCITATIPGLPAQPVQKDYDDNWGVEVAVDATVTSGEAIGKSYSSVALDVTGSPLTGLRVAIHRAGDDPGVSYCAPYKSGPIALTNFNTACWDNTGTAFTLADASKINNVGIEVPATQTPITVTNLCIKSITFAK